MYYTYDRLSRVTAGTVKRISDNELITADGHTYTYNAEGVRIRNLCECGEDTTYTYNTNCKLSRLLMKTTDGVVTKYVYGNGLIGEEVENTFKTYHFDFRGSTIAITDASGNITDTFAYDTYGKCISRTGTSDVIFGYNGRDGVVTDSNGLIYMRARYYSPEMKRFINADIVAGSITNAVTLNRFAYANGNPISFVDPFGLSVWSWIKDKWNSYVIEPIKEKIVEPVKKFLNEEIVQPVLDYLITNAPQPIANFAEDVKYYDGDNTDEQKVFDAHYFCSYKDTLVIKLPIGSNAFSYGIIGLGNDVTDVETIKHEYGHKVQFNERGILDFTVNIAIPSLTANILGKMGKLPYDYYGSPWEAEADSLGGVSRKTHNTPWTSEEYSSYWDLIKMFFS